MKEDKRDAEVRMHARRFAIFKRLLERKVVYRREVPSLVSFKVQTNSVMGDFKFLKDQFYHEIYKTDEFLCWLQPVFCWPQSEFTDAIRNAVNFEGGLSMAEAVVKELTAQKQIVCCLTGGAEAYAVASEMAQSNVAFKLASNSLPILRVLTYNPKASIYSLGGMVRGNFETVDHESPDFIELAGRRLRGLDDHDARQLGFDAAVVDAAFLDLARFEISTGQRNILISDLEIRERMLRNSHSWYLFCNRAHLSKPFPGHLDRLPLFDCLVAAAGNDRRYVYIVTDLPPQHEFYTPGEAGTTLLDHFRARLQPALERMAAQRLDVDVYVLFAGEDSTDLVHIEPQAVRA